MNFSHRAIASVKLFDEDRPCDLGVQPADSCVEYKRSRQKSLATLVDSRLQIKELRVPDDGEATSAVRIVCNGHLLTAYTHEFVAAKREAIVY